MKEQDKLLLYKEIQIIKDTIWNNEVDVALSDFIYILSKKESTKEEIFIIYQLSIFKIKSLLPNIYNKYKNLFEEFLKLLSNEKIISLSSDKLFTEYSTLKYLSYY